MENQNPNNASRQQTINIQVPSADNIASRRPLIPASFALAIILFFFTFCDFKCGGQKIGSVTGINLVTGTELKDRDMFTGRETKGKEIPASMWAILAFGAAIVGLGAFLIKEKREAIIGTGAGVIGAGSMIILQFVIKNAIDKEAKGQVDVDFQFPYWGALLALGVGGLISYLRMRQTHNVVVNFSPPQTTPVTQTTEESSAQPQVQTVSQPIQQTGGFDIAEWFKNNSKKVIGAVVSILVLYGAWFFLLRHDPESDAKKAASAYCNCSEKYNDGMIKADEDFINSFASNNFTKRQDARNKLQELQNPVNTANSECQGKAQTNYSELRNRYLTNEEALKKFDFAYNAQQGVCNPSNQAKLTSMYSEVDNKISTIKDPEPDIEKIKTDLIGQQVPGWRFAYLNEYKGAEILNTTRGTNRIEYQIKFNLIDNNSNSEHDCEVMVVYMQGDQGWYFNNVNMNYITYVNTFYPDRYTRIQPLQNCRWNAENNYKMSWKTSDWTYASETITGPSEGAKTLPSSNTYYIKSLEGQEIKVKFTYRPNN